ncbi:MAG: family 43 glycosylhydrolase, partial [Candidatus Izemoplasmatales bacterium]|nr:family 43 glycosylhydrolase [Candidatus Izemoplasmatales bacterium]
LFRSHEEIFLAEIDIISGRLLSKRKPIWGGTGGNNPEGPHLYKINAYYYLLIAEGGTEHGHMVTIARSKNVDGQYESCPHNPVLTNRGTRLPIKAVGHADLIEDQNGNWWAVCLGIRPISYPFRHNLGRETFLTPLCWDDDGWPRFGYDGHLHEEVETELLPLINSDIEEQNHFSNYYIDFCKQKPDHSWNTIYNPIDGLWESTKSGLAFYGNENSIMEAKPMAWLGKRQQHHECIVKTKLSFSPAYDNDEAGLAVYLNNRHHYEIALTRLNQKRFLILRRQIGSLWKIENVHEYNSDKVELIIEANKHSYIFKYDDGIKETILGSGETAYLTTEVGGVFTGNFFALYASIHTDMNRSPAFFSGFEYLVTT